MIKTIVTALILLAATFGVYSIVDPHSSHAIREQVINVFEKGEELKESIEDIENPFKK